MLFKKDKDKMICPRCHKPLETIKKADILIDICKNCGGMWLDNGEIDKLVGLSKRKEKGKKDGKKKKK